MMRALGCAPCVWPSTAVVSRRCLCSGVSRVKATVISADDEQLETELGLRRAGRRQFARQRERLPSSSASPAVQVEGPLARISTAALRKDVCADDLTAMYVEDGRALYEGCHGFRGSLLLFNRERSKARSITLWQEEEDMHAATKQPMYTDTMRALASHFATAPDVEVWSLAGSFFTSDESQPRARPSTAVGDEKEHDREHEHAHDARAW
jgi:hypothetical protein